MLVVYDGKHSINFFNDMKYAGHTDNVFNTWRDWHLIPAKKPYVAPAEPEIKLMQIPASNAILDLTDYYSGGMRYSIRSGEWEFFVDLNWWQTSNAALSYFISNLHGKKLFCELTDHLGTIYSGRFVISGFESTQTLPVLKITYRIYPTVGVAGSMQYDDEEGWIIHYDETADYDDDEIPEEIEPWVDPSLCDEDDGCFGDEEPIVCTGDEGCDEDSICVDCDEDSVCVDYGD